jgi:integrating conjugative element protein (TIGR03765 family)
MHRRTVFNISWYKRALAIGLFLSALCAPALVVAAPIVIHEGGPTVPISQYLSSFFEGDRDQRPPSGITAPPGQPPVPMTFPVVTRSMVPGRLPAAFRLNLKGWLIGPVFFVGADPLSRDWLTRNRDRLTRAGATGVVVNVANLEEFRATQALAPTLPMAPASVEGLATQLRLRTYPAVISVNGLVAQ